ncbi:MAG: ABC transporter substrate-binding protein [Oscillospiraceae bacterium]|nr:ABC transporter substrate-binding protein [Oscillospiraceae bacterium]
MKKSMRLIAMSIALAICFALVVGCSQPNATGDAAQNGGSTQTAPTTPSAPSPEHVEAATPDEGANLADHIDIIIDATQITVVNPLVPAGTGGPTSWTYILAYDKLLEQFGTDFGPQLAVRWETEDYKTWRFYLRDDVYFHNGDHFTAEDVVWTANIAMTAPGSPAYARWRWVDTIAAVEDYVLEVVLTEVYVDFLFEMAHAHAGILNQRAHSESPDDPSWAHVGTGPFKIVDFATNDFVALERFEDYWGGPAPTRSLTLWTIPEMAARTVMLQTGSAQLSFNMTPEDLDMLVANDYFTVLPVLSNAPIIIGFNYQGDDIMRDINFRKAVAHAINVEDIATVAMGNWGIPVSDGSFWGYETQFRLQDLPRREHDLELARQYLEASVYNGETITLITTVAYNIRASELIQLQLANIGINVSVEITDVAGFVDIHMYNPDSDRQMHVFAVPAAPVALNALRTGFYPGMATNRLNYNNEYVTALINELAATPDVAARTAIAYEIQAIFYEEMPAIPLWWRVAGIPTVNGIGGMRLGANPFDYCLRGIFWDLNQTPEHLRP